MSPQTAALDVLLLTPKVHFRKYKCNFFIGTFDMIFRDTNDDMLLVSGDDDLRNEILDEAEYFQLPESVQDYLR